MRVFLLCIVLWAAPVFAQSNSTPLTNETIIRLLASGVPADTVIRTIQSAASVNFGFGPADSSFLQHYQVPDNVVKAMAAKAKGLPVSVPPGPPSELAHPAPAVPARSVSPPPALNDVLDNASLIKLARAGMSEDVLLGLVNSQPGKYSLSPDSLIALKQASISDRVITAMVNRSSASVAPFPNTQSKVSASQPEQREGTPARVRLPRILRSAPGQMFDVKIINREANETEYSFVVPGSSRTNTNANANCTGIPNTVYCAGSATSTTSSMPAQARSYTVTGATWSLQLPDGRIAVVNCESKANWTQPGRGPRRSCRLPLVDNIQAEFDGDSAKLKWNVSIDGKKVQDETYKILAVIDRP